VLGLEGLVDNLELLDSILQSGPSAPHSLLLWSVAAADGLVVEIVFTVEGRKFWAVLPVFATKGVLDYFFLLALWELIVLKGTVGIRVPDTLKRSEFSVRRRKKRCGSYPRNLLEK
jgi:hypothetical protein